LSQYLTCNSVFHSKLLLNVLHYVVNTSHYVIDLNSRSNNQLTCFSDTSWANDRDSRKSFGGFVIFFAGVPVMWACRKQKTVALSTMEAEFVTLTDAVKESHWFANALESSQIFDDATFRPIVYTDSI